MARVPLSALLSQALVAYTVELDNEFERQTGARLSLIVWLNLLRFVPATGISFRSLAERTISGDELLKHQLGCLERWGFVALAPAPGGAPALLLPHCRAGRVVRDGFGSGRGIRTDWIVAPTPKGATAQAIWQPLPGVIEQRWISRFGEQAIRQLRESLWAVVGRLDVELPQALPTGGTLEVVASFPARSGQASPDLPLVSLLSQTLLAFTIAFDRESEAPLAMCANTLRVVTADGVRVAELAQLTGSSPEMTAIGWRLAKSGYVAVEGGMVGLTERGAEVQRDYQRLTAAIEKRWKSPGLRDALEGILAHPLLSEGLVPPAGVVRAGDVAPALGRRDVGSAARQRARDLVAQSKEFVRDPRGSLPHYPLWDMNRGFGP